MRSTWFRRFVFTGVIVLLATGSVGLAQQVKPLPAESPQYHGVCEVLHKALPWTPTGAGGWIMGHLMAYFGCDPPTYPN